MAKKKTANNSAPDTRADDPIDFESSLAEVEQIVAQLEGGELNLTESLHQYELGIRRLKRCHQLLEAAEQKVNQLAGFDADGNPVLEPLSDSSRAARSQSGGSQSGGSQSAEFHSPPSSVDDSPGLF